MSSDCQEPRGTQVTASDSRILYSASIFTHSMPSHTKRAALLPKPIFTTHVLIAMPHMSRGYHEPGANELKTQNHSLQHSTPSFTQFNAFTPQ